MANAEESIKRRIVEKLAKKHAIGANTVSKSTIEAFFPSHDRAAVDTALKELVREPESPVTTGDNRREIALKSRTDAFHYLTSHGVDAEKVQYYHQLLHQAETGGLSDDNTTDSEFLKGVDDGNKQIINELQQDLRESEEAAKSWREETREARQKWRRKARRRQWLSIVLALLSLMLGIVIRHIIPLFF